MPRIKPVVQYDLCPHTAARSLPASLTVRSAAKPMQHSRKTLVIGVCCVRQSCVAEASAWLKQTTGKDAAWESPAAELEARKPTRFRALAH
ncbi:MAG TPA: hypothetical protein VFU07_05590 [Candidatus Lumbricidophila sp.]|nr:hypothetical protein [Candidatus Lumbricidophila sp.]